MTRPRTRRRRVDDRPGARTSSADRTRRTINQNPTPGGETQHEFVNDADVVGRRIGANDRWLVEVRFGQAIAAAVASGAVECRHDIEGCAWYFRTPDMRHVSVEDVTNEMRARFALFMISEAA